MKSSNTLLFLGLIPGLLLATEAARAVTPNPSDFQLRQQWVASWITAQPGTTPTHLKLVEEDVHDTISRDRSWRGTPFQIGDKTYEHGLAFNANKRLRIHLDCPATQFTTDVGLENNDDTRRGAETGNGSVTFHVLAGGKELFTSPVLRLKDGPRPLVVPLQGTKEFEIRVGDGGDGPCEKLPADFPFDWARRVLDQYVSIRDYYYGDYYPLTSYTQAADAWMAYQLDRPERGDGLVVALRRPRSPYVTARFPLRGLDAKATYVVTNLDSGEQWIRCDIAKPGRQRRGATVDEGRKRAASPVSS